MRLTKFNNIICLSLFTILLFASCGAKRKVARSNDRVNGGIETNVKKEDKNVTSYYAQLLETDPKNLNDNLYKFIDKWMGSPHRLGGQHRDGIDCSAFVGHVFREVYQKDLPRSSKDMAEVIKRKYDHQLKEGDLVFFSFGGKSIDHVGVYLHNGKFVHVSTKQGVVISNLKDAWYYKYFTRCGTPII